MNTNPAKSEKVISESVNSLISRYHTLYDLRTSLIGTGTLLLETFTSGNKLLICGNGGSVADADHIVGELVKSFRKPRPLLPEAQQELQHVDIERGRSLAEHLQEGVPAISLAVHTALSTAFANDVHPSMSFAQQTFVYGSPRSFA